MATSDTIICNYALKHLGIPSISSLTEGGKVADACNELYEQSRDFVLQDYDWGFAERRAYGAVLSDETIFGYDYAYAFPSDALKIRRIYEDAVGSEPIKFTINAASDLNSQMVLTDEYQAVLVYTAKITNPNVFSKAFEVALSWKLASDLAIPLTKSASIERQKLEIYNIYIARAQTLDAQQGNEVIEVDSEFITARS